MSDLNQRLKNIQRFLEPRWKAESLSNTLADGSLVNSGKMITASKPVAAATPLAIMEEAQPTTSLSLRNLSTHSAQEHLHWKKRPIGETQDAREALAVLVGSAHAIQNSYNVPAEYVTLRIAVFQEELAGFIYEEVDAAFKSHMRQSPNAPTLHDILDLLNAVEPVVTETMAIIIRQKMRDNIFVTDKERDHLRLFEQQQLRKNDQIRQCQRRQQASGHSMPPAIDHASITDIEPMED